MFINELYPFLSRVLASKFFNKRYPLFVTWTITNKCNFSCSHCVCSQNITNELSTTEVLLIIKKLHFLGMRFLSFLGGEPLLRTDIEEIGLYCKKLKIKTRLTTNASLLHSIDAKKSILSFDVIKISLDGTRKAHDFIRGEGSFDDALKAGLSLKNDYKKKVQFNCVITKSLTSDFDHFSKNILEYKIPISFQVLEDRESGVLENENLRPRDSEHALFLDKVLRLKKENPSLIVNSQNTLKLLKAWPTVSEMTCFAGRLFMRIDPQGNIFSCDRKNEAGQSLLSSDFNLQKLSEWKKCQGCLRNNTLEINQALSFDLLSISSLLKNYFKIS